jgi:hypothetical protein
MRQQIYADTSTGQSFVTTESIGITGRSRVPLHKKFNPIWWFRNDTEETVHEATWYRPEWPRWRRWLYWTAFRNPAQNFRAFVIGVQDKNYIVTGRAPVLTVQRDDLEPPESGWQWCVLHRGNLLVPRVFVSYSGRIVFYAGWQPTGFFGVKLIFRTRSVVTSETSAQTRRWVCRSAAARKNRAYLRRAARNRLGQRV